MSYKQFGANGVGFAPVKRRLEVFLCIKWTDTEDSGLLKQSVGIYIVGTL